MVAAAPVGVSTRSRAAASSMASGRPSRRRADGGHGGRVVVGQPRTTGRTARARSANNCTAAARPIGAGSSLVSARQRQAVRPGTRARRATRRGTRLVTKACSPGSGEELGRRRAHRPPPARSCRAPAGPADGRGRRPATPGPIRRSAPRPTRRSWAGPGPQLDIGARFDEVHAVGILGRHLVGDGQRQAGLADAAGTGEGHEPGAPLVSNSEGPRDLPLAIHQAGQLGRQPDLRRPAGLRRRKVGAETRRRRAGRAAPVADRPLSENEPRSRSCHSRRGGGVEQHAVRRTKTRRSGRRGRRRRCAPPGGRRGRRSPRRWRVAWPVWRPMRARTSAPCANGPAARVRWISTAASAAARQRR